MKPPAIKHIVAINDDHCKVLMPIIAWPDVQPPAYLVPKPTRKPPTTMSIKPLNVNNELNENNCLGTRLEKSLMPYLFSWCTNTGFTCKGSGLLKKYVATKAPMIVPPAKNKFHASRFQLYLKNGMFAGKQAAHICRRLAEMPKCLFPVISKIGTINPMIKPDTYQGHGCFINSIIQNENVLSDNSKLYYN